MCRHVSKPILWDLRSFIQCCAEKISTKISDMFLDKPPPVTVAWTNDHRAKPGRFSAEVCFTLGMGESKLGRLDTEQTNEKRHMLFQGGTPGWLCFCCFDSCSLGGNISQLALATSTNSYTIRSLPLTVKRHLDCPASPRRAKVEQCVVRLDVEQRDAWLRDVSGILWV